jgi:uncharacterized protein involved in exopolysaccharide biosynthesis
VSHEGDSASAAELIRDVAQRLRDVVDEESACHEQICTLMGQLVMGGEDERPGMGELIEALQYFDRLQQRTAALCRLVESLAGSMSEDADTQAIAREFCRTAPVARDAQWLASHTGQDGGSLAGFAGL